MTRDSVMAVGSDLFSETGLLEETIVKRATATNIATPAVMPIARALFDMYIGVSSR
jgi:hypothetical protein